MPCVYFFFVFVCLAQRPKDSLSFFAVFFPLGLLFVINFRERTFVFCGQWWFCVFSMVFCLDFRFMVWRLAPETVQTIFFTSGLLFGFALSLSLYLSQVSCRRRFCSHVVRILSGDLFTVSCLCFFFSFSFFFTSLLLLFGLARVSLRLCCSLPWQASAVARQEQHSVACTFVSFLSFSLPGPAPLSLPPPCALSLSLSLSLSLFLFLLPLLLSLFLSSMHRDTAQGVRRVTTGNPGCWHPNVHSDVASRSFDVGSSYHWDTNCEHMAYWSFRVRGGS